MCKYARSLILVSLLLSIPMVLIAGGAQTVAPPASEELEADVAMYASITAIEPVLEAFKAETGVQPVNTRMSTGAFLSTVLTEFEARRLQADILQAPLPILEILREQGVIETFVPNAVANYPDWAKRDGIYLFGIEYVGLIYNKELVRPEDVPRTYQDLTHPRWRNQIVMANPESHATTIGWLVGLKEHVFATEAEWREFLQGLAANNPMFVASFGPTPAPIASGEKLIGISMPKYIVTLAPAPLDWARLENDQPLMGTPRAIAMTKGAPNPNAAKAFLEFWLGTEAATILARDVGEYVTAPGVFPPIDGMDTAKVIPIRELSNEEISYWGAEFRKIFFEN